MKLSLSFTLWSGVALLSALVAGANAFAYVVNSTGDGDRVACIGGICDLSGATCNDGTGHCTLRAAIESANLHAGTDTISFNIPTTDPHYSHGVWTIFLVNGSLPDITSAVSISGPGAARLVVNGNNGNHQFRVFNVTTTGTVSFSGITILNGAIDSTQGGGGAIQNVNSGTVNITNCTLRENGVSQVSTAEPTATGGAIYNPSGTVNVTSSTFSSNYAATVVVDGSVGGAIYNGTGIIHVSNSTFYHNEAAGDGGGIHNSYGIVTVTGSTFFQNGATFGGGISSQGTLSVTNSTFYANIAHRFRYGLGGAIYNAGTMNLTNSTVTANFSDTLGSGVYNDTFGTANVKSTIIALNYGGTSDNFVGPDVYGAFRSAGFNLIGKKDGSTGFSAATDKKGTIASPLDPKLDGLGLRNNGGPTQTIALMAGSAAIDAGTSVGLTGTLTKDQRGSPRTFDNTSVTNASGGDGTDIGSYERETQ